ncbi:alpha/beta hydrolase [Streptomyces sp. NPDC006339]|uniref:alpha/beta fold hydrolase n=1 Tax=Streptomyces sp. NPDC006339 TaxID=3156755 RepID=UPI0033AEE1D5
MTGTTAGTAGASGASGTTGAASAGAASAGATWTERTLVRDSGPGGEGVRLSLRDWGGGGTGRSLLLLHGLAGHAGEWDGVARRLRADGHRVVALDQRGHGASERHPKDVSRAAYVADILAVLDHLGLTDTVLVGQSYGGHAALLTAAATAHRGHPPPTAHRGRPAATGHHRRLAGAVLVEAGPGGADPAVLAGVGDWLRAWPVPFPSRDAAVAHLGGGPVGEGWADGLEERDGGLWPRFDPEIMIASLAENAGRARWEEWAAIDVPVLAVLGQNGIIPAEEYDEMSRLLPGLRGACVPGTGHDLHLERPGVLYDLIDGFLSETPCAGVDFNT